MKDVAEHVWSYDDITEMQKLQHAMSSNALTTTSPKHKNVKINNPTAVTIQDIKLEQFFKEVNISCDSIDQFTTFYNSLHSHGLNYNMHVTLHKNINGNKLSKPLFRTDVADYMNSTLHSILSKDGVFNASFKEGRTALSLTNNGFEVLDALLGQSHPNLCTK